jgi:uncharacterized membrane protein YdjX (TVP38/TMEM64 family)
MKRPALLMVAIVAALLVTAWRGGWLGALSDREAMQATIAQAGFWGPLLFVALAVGLFAAFMLAPPVWAATAVWPLPLAFAYSFAAALLASVITYVGACWLGQDWTQERVPASIQRWEASAKVNATFTHPVVLAIAVRKAVFQSSSG